jgi:hypothetical protein
MITGEILSNGTLKLILQGDDEVSKAAIRALDGATVKVFVEPIRILDKNIPEGAIVELKKTTT